MIISMCIIYDNVKYIKNLKLSTYAKLLKYKITKNAKCKIII